MKHLLCLLFSLIIIRLHSNAQEPEWDVYMQQYDLGPGSTIVDLSLIKKAPMDSFPFVIITGIKFADCTDEGLPQTREFENLYRISDSIGFILSNKKGSILVGVFTYQCKRLDYYYVSDTSELFGRISECYKRSFPNYEYHLSINHEPTWVTYTDFLYPKKHVLLYMENRKLVADFQDKGDSLTKARKVDHWIYFSDEKGRSDFISFAVKNRFKVEDTQIVPDSPTPFQLHISRIDKIDLLTITAITGDLGKQAFLMGGEYDGWEAEVVK